MVEPIKESERLIQTNEKVYGPSFCRPPIKRVSIWVNRKLVVDGWAKPDTPMSKILHECLEGRDEGRDFGLFKAILGGDFDTPLAMELDGRDGPE